MCEVYRAKDTRLDRIVAVKVLPAGVADDPETMARFEREAKAVAALSHPNLLAIHDFGKAERTAYAVNGPPRLEGPSSGAQSVARRSPAPMPRRSRLGLRWAGTV